CLWEPRTRAKPPEARIRGRRAPSPFFCCYRSCPAVLLLLSPLFFCCYPAVISAVLAKEKRDITMCWAIVKTCETAADRDRGSGPLALAAAPRHANCVVNHRDGRARRKAGHRAAPV